MTYMVHGMSLEDWERYGATEPIEDPDIVLDDYQQRRITIMEGLARLGYKDPGSYLDAFIKELEK